MPYECYIKFESTRSNLMYSGDSLLRTDLLPSSNSVSTIAALLQLEIILTSDAVDKYYRYNVLPRNFSSPLSLLLFSLLFFFSLIRTDILSLLGFVFLFFFFPPLRA